MNQVQYDKSFSYSEIFGKFLTQRLERLTFSETELLISKRLNIIDKNIEDVFDEDIVSLHIFVEKYH